MNVSHRVTELTEFSGFIGSAYLAICSLFVRVSGFRIGWVILK